MTKKIEVNVGTLEEAGKRFIEAWHAAQKSNTVPEAREFLTFENLELLLQILTPRRLVLLRHLRNKGPMSIRALAKELDRDYSNVHTDTKQLVICGLIEKSSTNEVSVPWTDLIVHFSLITHQKGKPKGSKHSKSRRGILHKKAS